MKKTLYLLLVLLLPLFLKSQTTTDLVIYSPYGVSFKTYINNYPTNNYFSTKTRVNDLASGNYFISIVFENQRIRNVDINVFLRANTETAILLQSQTKDVFYAEVFEVLDYSQQLSTNNNNFNNNFNNNHNYNNSNSNSNNNQYNPVQNGNNDVVAQNKYCNEPMTDSNFEKALKTIKNKDFEDDKLEVATQVVQSNCMLARQVKQIMETFSFDENKLAFAKIAYTHTFDINNYFIVYDAFTFHSNSKKLSEYIDSLN